MISLNENIVGLKSKDAEIFCHSHIQFVYENIQIMYVYNAKDRYKQLLDRLISEKSVIGTQWQTNIHDFPYNYTSVNRNARKQDIWNTYLNYRSKS